MTVIKNKYIADEGKVFVYKDTMIYVGRKIYLGKGRVFEDIFAEVDEAAAIYPDIDDVVV